VMTASRVHGGPGAQGAAPHDFSTNANACGPCPPALALVQAADAIRYPDPGYAALRGGLAAFHGVAPGRIVPAASGSEFIFRLTAWAWRQGARRVLLPRHGFGDYALAARAWGMEAAQAGSAAGLAWACEPSSPLGGPHQGIEGLAANQGVVVLDRAYEPLRLDGSPALNQRQLDRVWQLWTPNKALGLSGVRGAYAIAPEGAQQAARELEELSASWPIGAHGVAMLQAWCEPEVRQWLAASLPTLRAWKARQKALCEHLGWAVLPSQANFFVCELPAGSTAVQRLPEHGVQLRDCASFGLPGHVRLSVQPPASQDALQQAWECLA